MFSTQISKILSRNRHTKSSFLGCYPADRIPRLGTAVPFPHSIVVNMDPHGVVQVVTGVPYMSIHRLRWSIMIRLVIGHQLHHILQTIYHNSASYKNVIYQCSLMRPQHVVNMLYTF
jgi:hypothetical protein